MARRPERRLGMSPCPAHPVILAVSDAVSPLLHNCRWPERLRDANLLISCGDLPYDYLEFLTSCYDLPLYYVLGNHDGKGFWRSTGTSSRLPEGGDNLEDASVEACGLLLAGLGGSVRYGITPKYQFTETEMWSRVLKLAPKLMANQVRYGRRLDILVTHSAMRGVQDSDDAAHRGFSALRWLVEWARPGWMLHGHTQFDRPPQGLVHTRVCATEVIYIPPFQRLVWGKELGTA